MYAVNPEKKSPGGNRGSRNTLGGKKHSRKRPEAATLEARLDSIEARLLMLESRQSHTAGSDLFRDIVHHKNEMALEREKKELWQQTPVEDLKDLSGKTSLSQKEAARKFKKDPRTIRNYVKFGELTKRSDGRIAIDQKFFDLLSKKHRAT